MIKSLNQIRLDNKIPISQERFEKLAKEIIENSEVRAYLKHIMPLFEEARDALPAISMASAKARGINLTLADRMDAVGNLEEWKKTWENLQRSA